MDKKRRILYLVIFISLTFIITYFSFDNKSANAIEKKSSNKKINTVFVDIKGAVKKPGVYEINSNSRIIDVIEKAGDLKKDADTSIINLSKKVKDEMYIIIYTKDEVSSYKDKLLSSSETESEINSKIICPDSDNDACISNNSISKKININTANQSDLETLSGIGSTKAKKIIEYREKQKFEKIEDIKNVPGIGDSLYEKIKDSVEV